MGESEITAVLSLIQVVRGQRVILDADLARLFGVSTSYLNQQRGRNLRRFPAHFAFTLTRSDLMLLQIATASRKRNLSKPPVAYTEYGAVMAANVLNSDRAIEMSVEVVEAFIRYRKAELSNAKLARKLAELERAVKARLDKHDRKLDELFSAVESLIAGASAETSPPKRRIGF